MKTRVLPPLAAAASLALLAALAMAFLATPLLASRAMGDTLWDQSSVDEFGAAYFNSLSGLPPFGSTMYAVCDVTVGPEGWIVDGISQVYTALDGSWGLAITSGKLVVIPKAGALPAVDPSTGLTVAMTGISDNNGHWIVSATGLNLMLNPGNYWIGITPSAPSGPFGPELQLSTTDHQGDDSPWYDPYGAFGSVGWSVPNAGVDANILVTGAVMTPTPTSTVTWGRLKNLYR